MRPLPLAGHDGATSRLIEITAQEFTFRLAHDPWAAAADTAADPIQAAAHLARSVIGAEMTECSLAVFVDTRDGIIGYTHVGRGTLNRVYVQPGDVIRPALLVGAVGVILAHNHPTGDPTPSHADMQHVRLMHERLDSFGLELLDGIVVTAGAWQSISAALFAESKRDAMT